MDNETALEKARELAEGDLPTFMITNRIAAALKRAYAAGIQWAAEHWASSLEDEEKRLRAEADQLEGK